MQRGNEIPYQGQRNQCREGDQKNTHDRLSLRFAQPLRNTFRKIEQNGLRTKPPAPDTPENSRNGSDQEEKKKNDKKNQVQLFYPDDRAEKIKFEFRDVESQGTLPVYDQERQAGNEQGLQEFYPSSISAPQNLYW